MASSEVVVNAHFANVMLSLNRQRCSDEFCDVVLEIEEKRFPAHRNVLSSCSEYFKKMFTINMKEKYERNVKVGGMSSHTMEEVLKFVYTARLDVNEHNVLDLLEAFSLMQIQDALDEVVRFMNKHLSTTNCLFFRTLGEKYLLNKLVRKANNFIVANFEKMIGQNEFYSLDEKTVELLLKSDDLKVEHEQILFDVVIRWINQDWIKRKECFPNLFKHIRLQFIPQQYLADTVRKHKLVREFPDCRDFIEDAFFYLMSPEKFPAQKPRKHHVKVADTILLLAYQKHHQYVLSTRQWISENYNIQNLFKPNCAVASWSNLTVVCGGLNRNNTASNEFFQVRDGIWEKMSPMKESRVGAAAIFAKVVWPDVSDRDHPMICVIGGEVSGPTPHIQSVMPRTLCSADVYFQEEGFWRKIDNFLLQPRSYARAELVEGRIYLMGGFIQTQDERKVQRRAAVQPILQFPCKEVDLYNLKSNTWLKGPEMNVARASFGSAVFNSKIYAVGGQENAGYENFAEFLDIKSSRWTIITSVLALDQSVTINPLGSAGARSVTRQVAKGFNSASFSSCCCVDDQIYVTKGNTLLRYIPLTDKWMIEHQQLPERGVIVPVCTKK